MAIRITGMYSGLDTESIINELASAQSAKKNKLVKAQKKLSWKQDAWKSLNTKIYSFYQKLDDLRLQSSYLKKKTTVSNPNALTVSGGNVDGAHKVKVNKLSQQASLTSGSLAKGDTYYTGNVTLKQLNNKIDFGSGSIRLSDAAGNYVDINVSADMTVNDFVKAVNNNTALKASFDQDNQRIYLNSWASGKDGDFFLTGNDAAGMEALKTLKLMSASDLQKQTAAGGEYDVWSKYASYDFTTGLPDYSTAAGSNYQAAYGYDAKYVELIRKEALNQMKAMKAENDKLEAANKKADEANQKNLDTLKEIFDNTDHKYDAYQTFTTASGDTWSMSSGYNSAWDKNMDQAAIQQAGKDLYDLIYGKKTQAMEDDGTTPKTDKDGNPVYERTGGMVGDLKNLQDDLKTAQEALEKARKDKDDGNATEQDVKDAEAAVVNASKAVSDKQTEINKAKEVSSVYEAYDKNIAEKKANQDKIDANNAKFEYKKDADGKETYTEKDASGALVADGSPIGVGLVGAAVAQEFDKKVAEAQKMMAKVSYANGSFEITDAALKEQLGDDKSGGTKVSGEDAEITVDGVKYTSSTDTLTVNGMQITALEQTDKDVTVSTKTDTEGVYNMIRDFITAYSELMNEMDSLYNAEPSSGYEPLTSEEKDALTDTEVEEWEKKIKDSLLRRDSTLSDVSSAMRMDMMLTMNIGGRTYSLADFGIETQSYFKAKDNERNAYHILGNKDDLLSWQPEDGDPELGAVIAKNPDAVMEFFTKLTNNLHDTIAEKMAPSKMSSALTVYNDKKMKEDYDDYTKQIKKQEEKLNSYIDKWYAKFSAMETALAKLESKNSSLSSLFGG